MFDLQKKVEETKMDSILPTCPKCKIILDVLSWGYSCSKCLIKYNIYMHPINETTKNLFHIKENDSDLVTSHILK